MMNKKSEKALKKECISLKIADKLRVKRKKDPLTRLMMIFGLILDSNEGAEEN